MRDIPNIKNTPMINNLVVDYINRENSNKSLHKKVQQQRLYCIYLNIQGLSTNFDNLTVMVAKYKPKLIILTETHITEDITDSEISLQGYNLIQNYSDSRHTGGVIIYVKIGIAYTVISNVQIERNWLMAIKISKGFQIGIYGVLYHSPNGNHKHFLEYFETWCEETMDLSNLNIIVGDFNIDIRKKQLIVQC